MKIETWLKAHKFNLKHKEIKTYGKYYTAEKYYAKENGYFRERKIELYISDITERNDRLAVTIRGGHYEGHLNGYVDKVEDLEPIINFVTISKFKNIK
jgi:hypothetical protein